ncbi:MAG TPA: hypothetical protein VNQ73_15320 [Ilumatobacter sp.]|nr:hypothetical protein [Ilumatobacter sp.]
MGIIDKVKDAFGKGDDGVADTADASTDHTAGLAGKLGGLAEQLPENLDDQVEALAAKLPGAAGEQAAAAVDAAFDKIPGQAD